MSSKPKTAPKATPAPTGSEEAGERSAYFRSFYVDNGVFERFRAAIFWTARNPQAAGHGEISLGVEAGDLGDGLERGRVPEPEGATDVLGVHDHLTEPRGGRAERRA